MQRQGIGNMLIAMVIDALTSHRLRGCCLLTLDAYQGAIPFDEQCGFQFLTRKDATEETRRMFLDLTRV